MLQKLTSSLITTATSIILAVILVDHCYAQAPAQNSYSAATYSGGTAVINGTSENDGVFSNSSHGAYGGPMSIPQNGDVQSANCSGTITASFVWNGPQPVPQNVVIMQYASTYWGGTDAENGHQGPFVTGSDSNPLGGTNPGEENFWTATTYSKLSGNSTVSDPISSLTAQAQVNNPPPSPIYCSAEVGYTANIYPVTINPVGATLSSDNTWNILIGQTFAPALVIPGLPSTCTVSNWRWTATGSTFSSWYADTNQSILYGSSAINFITPTPHWCWSDFNTAKETVTCTATVTPPGQSSFDVTATVYVQTKRPTAMGRAEGGMMQVNAHHSNNAGYWLYAGPIPNATDNSQYAGMYWMGALSSPDTSLFPTVGDIELVQLNQRDRSYTTYAGSKFTDSLNGVEGLDTTFPYGWNSQLGSYQAIDSPGFQLADDTDDRGSADTYTAHFGDDFEDYIIYMPPTSSSNIPSQWVPLLHYVWSGKADVQQPKSPGWVMLGAQNVGSVTDSQVLTSFEKWGEWPEWTQNTGNGEGGF